MTRKPDLPTTSTDVACGLCLDEALVAEVLAVSRSGELAEVSMNGHAVTVAIDLIDAVEVGDRLLVHAGFAIARIED